MGSVETDMTMTTAERFAVWLADAMRRKKLNIDSLRGGGRIALAKAVDVSPSTVNRWLAGGTMPDPAKFEPIAAALDTEGRDPAVATIEMLTEIGILSAQLGSGRRDSAVASDPTAPMTLTEAADRLDMHGEGDREQIHNAAKPPVRPARDAADEDVDGGTAAEG